MADSDTPDDQNADEAAKRERSEQLDREQRRIFESRISEMYAQRKEARSKYTYFLMAAAGAAIAFAMKNTETAAIHWSQIPLAVALLYWGLSFWYGLQCLDRTDSHAGANMDLLRVIPVQVGIQYKEQWQYLTALDDNMRQFNREILDRSKQQLVAFSRGAVAFVLWHIGEMIVRTAS